MLEAFTPDFYLPEQDLYVEVTTMKQSLVTKKNRKVRRLRELYPDVRIRILYRRDIDALADRHGLRHAAVDRARPGRSTCRRRRSPSASPSSPPRSTATTAGAPLTLVAVLKGAVVLCADLSRALTIPHRIDTIQLTPYRGSQGGRIRLTKDLDHPVRDEHVIVVEDVIDTGLTLLNVVRALGARGAASRRRVRAARPAPPAARRARRALPRIHGRRAPRGRLRPGPSRPAPVAARHPLPRRLNG